MHVKIQFYFVVSKSKTLEYTNGGGGGPVYTLDYNNSIQKNIGRESVIFYTSSMAQP